MSTIGRIFRVFVSSTFSDFELERQVLHDEVFPLVDAYCRDRKARFQPIDLRWGISDEASQNRRITAICLDEVRRCREVSPDFFFIALLGGHYGSHLLTETISAPDFTRMLAVLNPEDQEILTGKYQLDRNSLPDGEYILRPRNNQNRITNAQEEKLQEYLIALLARACQTSSVTPATRLNILTSLTEREIEVGILSDDGDSHALCFQRTTEWNHSKGTDDPHMDTSAIDRERLDALKRRVHARLPGGIVELTAHYKNGIRDSNYLVSFRQRAYGEIIQRINSALEKEQAVGDANAQAHRRFVSERLRFFTGRNEPLQQINSYLQGDAGTPLLITGAAGVGKTAALLQAEQNVEQQKENAVLFHYFIGGSSPISDLTTLLSDLYQSLLKVYEIGGNGIPLQLQREKLVAQFSNFLALATSDRPLIIFLDALDQLQDTQEDMSWLPGTLPPHVHLVASVLPSHAFDSWQEEHPYVSVLSLKPLLPKDAEQVLNELLSSVNRTLQPEQRTFVLERFTAVGLPLYWRLAFEGVRQWRSWQIDEHLPTLSGEVTQIIRAFFDQLESPSEHGHDFIEHALGLIAAARDGLSEQELLAIINRDPALVARIAQRSMHSPSVNKLPMVLWARLIQDLNFYLTERIADDTVLMNFYHRQIREVAMARYLEAAKGVARHMDLAEHFADDIAEPLLFAGIVPNARKLAELPFQQALAGSDLKEELSTTLTDASFLEQKARRFGIDALLNDYAYIDTHNYQLMQVANAIRAGSVVLTMAPDEMWNQIQGHAALGALLHASIPRPVPRFELSFASLLHSDEAVVRIFQGHVGGVTCCAFSRDGQRILSASDDGTMRLWNVDTGLTLREYKGHAEPVNACTFSPDERYVLSASKDLTLRLWETDTGHIVQVYTGHPAQAVHCEFTPDGQYIVSNSSGFLSSTQEVAIWDVKSGRTIRTFKGNALLDKFHVSHFALSPDGKFVLSDSAAQGMRLWSLQTGKSLRAFKWRFPEKRLRGWWERRTAIVTDCAFSPDGKLVVASTSTGLDFGRIQVWNTDSGNPVRLLQTDTGSINSCAFSPNSRFVISAHFDGALRMWDVATGEQVKVLSGHTQSVKDCIFSPDGRQVLSASKDHTIRLWNVAGATAGHTIARHSQGVGGCAISPDGRLGMSTSIDGAAILWDVKSGTATQRLKAAAEFCQCMFSPDGKFALYGSEEHSLTLWNLANNCVERTFKGHRGVITCCAVHPGGDYALSSSWDKTLRLWDIDTGQTICTYYGHKDAVYSCAFSPDGKSIASASRDSSLWLWDTGSGKTTRILRGHSGAVWHCAFSPDMRYVLSASADKTLRLWDVSSGRTVHVFDGHSKDVRQCLFSPDGEQFFSASDDGTLRYWDVATRSEVMRWTTDTALRHCAFDHGMSRMMVGDDLGGVHFLRLIQ